MVTIHPRINVSTGIINFATYSNAPCGYEIKLRFVQNVGKGKALGGAVRLSPRR